MAGKRRRLDIHVIVEPFTSPPTHSRSVHTAPPFMPTRAVALPEDELPVALGLAPALVIVALDAPLELALSSLSSSWRAENMLASAEYGSTWDPPLLVASLLPLQASQKQTEI